MTGALSLSRALLLGVSLAWVVPAAAQTTEAVGLAREMLVASRASDNFDAILPTLMNALKPAITRGDAKASKDWDELAPIMTSEFSVLKTELLDGMAALYAKAFEPGELRAFVAFYKSPAGDKLARLTPSLAQQTLVLGQSFGQKVSARLAERMQEELRKRGNKI